MEDAREELQRPVGLGVEGLRRRVASMHPVETVASAITARRVGQQDGLVYQHQHHNHNHDAVTAASDAGGGKPMKKQGKPMHPVDGVAANGAGALLFDIDKDAVEGEEDVDGCTPIINHQGEAKGGKVGTHRRITTEGDVEVEEDDLCCFDWGLLVEPVTLLCGHTFCRHCVGIILDDSQTKTHGGTPHTPGSMKCPLCCRSLPAVLPQPNVRLRNDLRAKYPGLYEYRYVKKDETRKEGGRAVGRAGAAGGGRGRGPLAYMKHEIILRCSRFLPLLISPSHPLHFPNRMETVGSAFVKKEEELRSQGKKKGASNIEEEEREGGNEDRERDSERGTRTFA